MSTPDVARGAELEKVPPEEAGRIEHIADLTLKQLESRYGAGKKFLRGVHPKDHGCIEASFTVLDTVAPEFRVGLFKNPGQRFRAVIRFSNAAPLVTPDSALEKGPDNKETVTHGSRGMAVKIHDVDGARLVPDDGERTQDLLMINQPVFAFANVEDYEALSQIIFEDKENPTRFFGRIRKTGEGKPDLSDAATRRALRSLQIISCIKSAAFPPAFQAPPLSPLDNRYFSAAPFLFGDDRVMKFSAKPLAPVSGELGDAVKDENYLRKALQKRLAEGDGKDILFDFQVQVRSSASLAGKVDTDIEDVCTLWDESEHPFVTVARIAVPPQEVSSPERQEFCERVVYTPWHGLVDHRPLGGINRMRREVYEKSAERRGCPVRAVSAKSS
jgi:hypothetical protein